MAAGMSGVGVFSGVRWSRLYRLIVGCAVLALVIPKSAFAQETELVRGIVSGVDKKPIEGATVTIQGLLNQQQRITTTNAKGLYNALFQDAEGEYIVSVRRIGYAPQVSHVLRTGMSPVIATNFTLTEVATALDDRTVTANRNLDGSDPKSIGGNERDLLAGAVFSLDPSDLLALAANIPGVMMIQGANGADSGYSVLGLGADANNLMVDGSTVNGNNLPSMAIAKASLTTNTYDITRGNFAGASMSVTTRAGTDVPAQNFSGFMTNRHLMWSDPNAAYQSPSNLQGSFGAGGPIIKRKLKYFGAMDISDNRTLQYSLLNAGSGLLGQYGITGDTVAATRAAIENLGLPVRLTGISDNSVRDNGSASLRLDFTPKANSSAMLSLRGSWNTSGGATGNYSTFPTGNSKSSGKSLGASFNVTAYVGGVQNDLTSSISYSSSDRTPYLALPGASVRIGTVFDDGRTGLSSIRFGGAGGFASHSTSAYGSITDQLALITTSSKHRIKLAGGLNYDESSSHIGNSLGSYTFQSIADLSNNLPASYSRSLSAKDQKYSGITYYVGPQDEWLVSQKLQLSIGVRTDFAHPGEKPPLNPEIESLFGFRNDLIPHSIGLSPRIGFSWTPTKGNPPKASATSPANIPAGLSADQASAMAKAMAEASVVRVVSASGAVMSMSSQGGLPVNGLSSGGGARLLTITGGIGLFRNSISSSAISRLVDQTGLPGTSRYLSCFGAASPVPVWTGDENNLPESCLDGTGPVTLTNSRPTVTLYDPNYKPLSRWSANAGIDGLRVAGWNVNITGSYNLSVNSSSRIDLNLRRDPQFNIAGEANRPVYVTPDNIVPETGIIIPNAARLNANYGGVSRLVSDLSSKYLNFQLYLTPPKPLFGKLPFTLNYTWVPYAVAQQRASGSAGLGGSIIEFADGAFYGGGASSSTDGDPFKKEWAKGTQSTHTIALGTSFRAWWFTLGLRFSLLSGMPYTPMVSGDINGDGSGGDDRAYVFNPKTIADPDFAAQMSSLLASTSPNARKCLEAQMGTIASRNSCKTAWNSRTDISLSFTPPKTLGFGDRVKFTAGFQNAGSALIRLAGLQNSFLGTQESSPYPDTRLLYVNGFDATSQKFNYRVNQLFGLPQDFGAKNSRLSPFYVRLGTTVALGGPPRSAMGTSLGLVAAKKEPQLTKEQVQTKLRELSVDPVAPIIKLSDSLKLTQKQADSLTKIGNKFWVDADSVFSPLAEYVVKLGKKMTDVDLNLKLPKARTDVQKLMALAKVKAMAVLTPSQRLLLPVVSGAARPPASGTGAPSMIPGPGGAPPAVKPPAAGGTGGDASKGGGVPVKAGGTVPPPMTAKGGGGGGVQH